MNLNLFFFFLFFCVCVHLVQHLFTCVFVLSSILIIVLLLRGRLVEVPLVGRIKYYQSIELNMALAEEERRRETGT